MALLLTVPRAIGYALGLVRVCPECRDPDLRIVDQRLADVRRRLESEGDD